MPSFLRLKQVGGILAESVGKVTSTTIATDGVLNENIFRND